MVPDEGLHRGIRGDVSAFLGGDLLPGAPGPSLGGASGAFQLVTLQVTGPAPALHVEAQAAVIGELDVVERQVLRLDRVAGRPAQGLGQPDVIEGGSLRAPFDIHQHEPLPLPRLRAVPEPVRPFDPLLLGDEVVDQTAGFARQAIGPLVVGARSLCLEGGGEYCGAERDREQGGGQTQ